MGTTSWGATLAWLLARNGHDVRLLCRTSDELSTIQRSRRAPRAAALELPAAIQPTHDAETALRGVSAMVLATPSRDVRTNARALGNAVGTGTIAIHAVKGLERATAKRVSEMLVEELPQLEQRNMVALSGPNLAKEIQRALPAATVVAGTDAANVERAQALFHSAAFRVYASSDLIGVELAGALKNVVALTAGIADGLGFGDNAKAGIITRALAEITRLGVAAGAEPATFSGLAGAGDVMATSYSPLSRNRTAGEAIGRGTPVADAIRNAAGVVEGVDATAAACVLAERHAVDMPIARALRDVLAGAAAPLDVIAGLLEREPKRETR